MAVADEPVLCSILIEFFYSRQSILADVVGFMHCQLLLYWEAFVCVFGVLCRGGLVRLQLTHFDSRVLAVLELLLASSLFLLNQAVIKLHAFGIKMYLHAGLELLCHVLSLQHLLGCFLMIFLLDHLDGRFKFYLRDLTH